MEINQQKIKELLNTKDIKLYDFDLKILTNRIIKLQNIYNIFSKNINSNNISIDNIKNQIKSDTNILIQYLQNNNSKINKIIVKKILNQELSNIIYNFTL